MRPPLHTLGVMREEFGIQQVQVEFVGMSPADRTTRAPGVSGVEVDGHILCCRVEGSFHPFLEALLAHEVLSLRTAPVAETQGS
jgi:hypothetical protein